MRDHEPTVGDLRDQLGELKKLTLDCETNSKSIKTKFTTGGH